MLSLPRKCFLVMFNLFSKNSFAMKFIFSTGTLKSSLMVIFFYEPSFITTIVFRCDAPFIVLFQFQQLRRPDLIGKLVEGSHSFTFMILFNNVEPLRGSFRNSFIYPRVKTRGYQHIVPPGHNRISPNKERTLHPKSPL